MKFIDTAINDVKIVEVNVFGDERGFFMETFREDEFRKQTGAKLFVQDDHSKSSQSILRGLHFQQQQTQGKLVRVTQGSVYDVAVDMRQSSATFGQAVGVVLSSENKRQLWVPEGFAHGFYVMSESAEFVFDGTSTTPYQTDATPNPINVYGASKLAGDTALQLILPEASVIVRTAWVYSVNGNNFVKSMLNLMHEKSQIGIIYNQIGTPNWAKGLAQWLWAITTKPEVTCTYHWTDAGIASWYDFAIAIQELGIEKGFLTQTIPVLPIPTSAYPTLAKRPAFSVLDKTSAENFSGLKTVHWRKQLSLMMDGLD
jgi:dTDP-4-dehydrorhamnose 3,5-epimerase